MKHDVKLNATMNLYRALIEIEEKKYTFVASDVIDRAITQALDWQDTAHTETYRNSLDRKVTREKLTIMYRDDLWNLMRVYLHDPIWFMSSIKGDFERYEHRKRLDEIVAVARFELGFDVASKHSNVNGVDYLMIDEDDNQIEVLYDVATIVAGGLVHKTTGYVAKLTLKGQDEQIVNDAQHLKSLLSNTNEASA